MSKNLVIVESPAKAKTIEKYLGKDFKVLSSYGHVRDLIKGDKAIDVKHDFKPIYQISEDKKEVIRKLKTAVKSVDSVWLATDDDREGEAISWHLKEVLKLSDEVAKRIVFREITKTAILKAIKVPRKIDYDLVDAQQARRILDRLVGFELSPILWKKIQQGLSAGRVQSIALRLITECEKEIIAFKPNIFFKSTAQFSPQDDKKVHFQAQLNKKFTTKAEGLAFVEICKTSVFTIENIKKTPSKRSPSAPFTTSSLQQEASKRLGFSVNKTMVLAQKLYEAGHITYMRTDSVSLSNEATNMAVEVIKKRFGTDYVQERVFKNRNKNAQEAHEAIRPTDFEKKMLSIDVQSQKLYTLIWQRTLASQMKDAIFEKSTVTIDISQCPQKFISQGQIITFEGFLKLYHFEKEDKNTEEKILPPLKEKQKLNLNYLICREQYTQNQGRYNEASLVRKLEVLGIGRPSTYAPIISTIQKRNYALKDNIVGKTRNYHSILLKDNEITQKQEQETFGTEKNKLLPTDIGKVVCKFLIDYFPNIMDYSFTAKAEEQLDLIASGKLVWNGMLKDFYGDFHKRTIEIAKSVNREDVSTTRLLGIDPKTKLNVIVRLGRYGPLVQSGEGENASYASLLKNQSLETITFEEALKLLALPRQLGLYRDKDITVAIGRFGPYIKHDDKFFSIKGQYEPLDITLKEAINIVLAKEEADKQKVIKVFEKEKMQVLKGHFGPYISYQAKNYKIPKGVDAPDITIDKCFEIIENKNKGTSKTKSRKKGK